MVADSTNHPVPTDDHLWSGDPPGLVMPRDGVPDRAHWMVSDQTDVPGMWSPRRTDWEEVLAPEQADAGVAAPSDTSLLPGVQSAVEMARTLKVTPEHRTAEATEVPMALWQKQAACNFTNVPKVSDYRNDDRPLWMDRAGLSKDSASPVYTETLGAYAYNAICANCHGANGDSAGRQATNLADMTGGNARVTDLAHKMFGTTGGVSNRQSVFGLLASDAGATGSATVDDWAARYFTWMAFGGTSQPIPRSILTIIANSQVFGETRRWGAFPLDANMLSTAESLCRLLVGYPLQGIANEYQQLPTLKFDPNTASIPTDGTTLLNGDYEAWLRICSINNPPPLRAVYVLWTSNTPPPVLRGDLDYYSVGADQYGALPVADHRGRVATGIQGDNFLPWCLRPVDNDAWLAKQTDWRSVNLSANQSQWPVCPSTVVAPSTSSPAAGDKHWKYRDFENWARRGAMNAGVLAYLYVEKLANGLRAKPSYDRCDQLGQSADAGR